MSQKLPPIDTAGLPTLDLHGYTKERALREAVEFLDAQRSWVVLVTGTGSHSLDGPVLRGAIESLLTKRKYTYSRNTPGSFLVGASTGSVEHFQASCEEDTKIIVGDAQDEMVAVQLAARRAQTRTKGFSGLTTGNNRMLNDGKDGEHLEVGPSLKEVDDSEKDFEEAKKESLELQRLMAKKATQEKRAMEKALSLSVYEEKRLKEEDEALVQAAIEASQEETRQIEQEDDLLKQAMAESKITAEFEADPEEYLEKILHQSRLETYAVSTDESEEDLIKKTIDMSLRERKR